MSLENIIKFIIFTQKIYKTWIAYLLFIATVTFINPFLQCTRGMEFKCKKLVIGNYTSKPFSYKEYLTHL